MLVTDVEPVEGCIAVLPTTRAQIVIPFLLHKQVVGLLNLETRHPERFTPEVFEFMKLIASRVASLINNAQLYENQVLLAQELDAFAHTVAHDLKNPLNLITTYGGLLASPKSYHLGDEQREHFLDMIIHGAHKMNAIIDALLFLANVRMTDTVEIVPVDMTAIIEDVCDRLDFMIRDAGATLVIPENWPVALGYAPWIEEVWINYISNAIKYGGTTPYIELGADVEPDGLVRFWVRDQGAGLTPEEQAQLFTPFTRLGQPEVEGHGLGLSIVERIVQRLGGQVGVESAPGKGSTSYFTLPQVTNN